LQALAEVFKEIAQSVTQELTSPAAGEFLFPRVITPLIVLRE